MHMYVFLHKNYMIWFLHILYTSELSDSERLLPYIVSIRLVHMERFVSFFIIRTAKEWNSLPLSVFQDKYKAGLFGLCSLRQIQTTEFINKKYLVINLMAKFWSYTRS